MLLLGIINFFPLPGLPVRTRVSRSPGDGSDNADEMPHSQFHRLSCSSLSQLENNKQELDIVIASDDDIARQTLKLLVTRKKLAGTYN